MRKKPPEEIDQMREACRQSGEDFIAPLRPLALAGSAWCKLATAALLQALGDSLADACGRHQYAVGVPGGIEMVLHSLEVLLQSREDLCVFTIDNINAFNAVERPAIERALWANPSLHPLLPLFYMLYLDRQGALWYYGAGRRGNAPFATLSSARGVRQGCVLGMVLFAVTVASVYEELATLGGPPGDQAAIFAIADDATCVLSPDYVPALAAGLEQAFGRVGLRVGYGPGKTSVFLQRPLQPSLQAELDALPSGHRPGVVYHLDRLLGRPFRPSRDATPLTSSLTQMAAKHDALLSLIDTMGNVGATHAALRLLQVAGVRRFQHLMRNMDPDCVLPFLRERDKEIRSTLACLVATTDDDIDTLISSPSLDQARLPTLLGGLNVPSIAAEAHAAYLSSYALTLGPLISHLRWDTACSITAALAHELASVHTSSHRWASSLRASHRHVMELTLTDEQLTLVNKLARRDPGFALAGDQGSATDDRRPRFGQPKIPSLTELVTNQQGHKKLMTPLSQTLRARDLLALLSTLPPDDRQRITTSSGQGSVAFLTSDSPKVHDVPPEMYVTMARQLLGLPSLPPAECPPCPSCGVLADPTRQFKCAQEMHIPRCPRGSNRHLMHHKLARCVRSIFIDAGTHEDEVKLEVKSDATTSGHRPGDVAALNYRVTGQHLLVDVSITASGRAALLDHMDTPGYAAATQELAKLGKYRSPSARTPHQPAPPHGFIYRHRFVPFVLEDGGRLGEHARALLVELAMRAAQQGKCPTDRRGHPRPSWLLTRWLEWISLALHSTAAKQIRLGLSLDDTYGPTHLGR